MESNGGLDNMKIKGVNLGNWLVLEKWMNPALFEGTTAEDEYYLPASSRRKYMKQESRSIVPNTSQSVIL